MAAPPLPRGRRPTNPPWRPPLQTEPVDLEAPRPGSCRRARAHAAARRWSASPWFLAFAIALAWCLACCAFEALEGRAPASNVDVELGLPRAAGPASFRDAARELVSPLWPVGSSPGSSPWSSTSLASARRAAAAWLEAVWPDVSARVLAQARALAPAPARGVIGLLGPPVPAARVRPEPAPPPPPAVREIEAVRRELRLAIAVAVALLVLVAVLALQWTIVARRERAIRRRAEHLADVAEAERARAESVARDKARFLGMLSHELLTPLQSIWSTMDVIESRGRVESRDAAFTRLKDSTRSLRARISDLVDFAKMSSGRLETRVRAFRFDTLVDTALRDLEEALAAKSLDVHWDPGPELARPIYSDPARLRQIIDNLLTNAVKYTERGGISINARLLDDTSLLSLEIADTGVGIEPEALARLFEPFYRAPATSAMAEGSGLGLAVVRSLVDLMGGAIHVDSLVGRGTAIVVEVPIAEGVEGLVDPPRRLEARGPVLVVDDSHDARRAIAEVIRALGIDVHEADGGRSGLAEAQARDYQAIILDLQMPDLSGYEVALRLREPGGRHEKTLLILVSAFNDLDAVTGSVFDARLDKPASRKDLIAALSRATPAGSNPVGPSRAASGAKPIAPPPAPGDAATPDEATAPAGPTACGAPTVTTFAAATPAMIPMVPTNAPPATISPTSATAAIPTNERTSTIEAMKLTEPVDTDTKPASVASATFGTPSIPSTLATNATNATTGTLTRADASPATSANPDETKASPAPGNGSPSAPLPSSPPEPTASAASPHAVGPSPSPASE